MSFNLSLCLLVYEPKQLHSDTMKLSALGSWAHSVEHNTTPCLVLANSYACFSGHVTLRHNANYRTVSLHMWVLFFTLTQQFFINSWRPRSHGNVMATNASVNCKVPMTGTCQVGRDQGRRLHQCLTATSNRQNKICQYINFLATATINSRQYFILYGMSLITKMIVMKSVRLMCSLLLPVMLSLLRL